MPWIIFPFPHLLIDSWFVINEEAVAAISNTGFDLIRADSWYDNNDPGIIPMEIWSALIQLENWRSGRYALYAVLIFVVM